MQRLNKNLTANWHLYMAIPALILFSLFFLYPLARGLRLSLMDWNGYSTPEFIGLSNFINFFKDDRALHDIANTIIFALGSAPLLNIFGLGLALLLNESSSSTKRLSVKGKKSLIPAVRGMIYLPAVISPMIMGSVWYLLLQPGRGLFAILLQRAGIDLTGNWMLSGSSAMSVIILVNVWQFAGMTMVIYLAGLQSIPGELYEAGRVEGAGRLQLFRYITVPQLLPAIRINVITNIIGSLSVFEVILALTDGGPGYATESLSIFIMRMSYGSRTGFSTAVAMILFMIILIPVLISMRFFDKLEDA
ncbi:MAG: sugar ABC transporter permease [Spirochaetes bacterium]|nr:sugar ABC transporter permease [Spirochaetota bacterium]